MQEDTLVLSRQDRDRLKVLHELRKGHLTQREAAAQLKLSERWIRELQDRIRERGDRAIVHALRGRTSTHRIPAGVEKRAIKIVEREYADFGPTLANEYLARDHGLAVSRETLRQWMMRAGIWQRHKQKLREVHVWRKRRSCFGELVQWDTSDHDWLEGRGPRIYLIAMIDDATSRSLAHFAEHDSTAENLHLLGSWLQRYGRFLDGYTDRASLFETNRPQRDEELGKLPETQIGRALRELGIGLVLARSPQAKGRIERFFATAQDRLVKGMRKRGIDSLQAANRYLGDEYLPLWNARFSVRPANPVDAHRPLGKHHDLASILSHVEQRVIGRDYTIRYAGERYQIVREQIQPRLCGQTVRVEQRLDGTIIVRATERELHVRRCTGGDEADAIVPAAAPAPRRKPVAAMPATGGRRRWMYGFDLRTGPSLEQVVRDAYGEAETEDVDGHS